MSDNPDKRGGQDRTRINVNQDHELRDWAQKFGVKPSALKDAVQAVGDRADKVEAHLRHLASQRAARGPHPEHAGSGNSFGDGRSGTPERKR
jgi:hypothetical protein